MTSTNNNTKVSLGMETSLLVTNNGKIKISRETIELIKGFELLENSPESVNVYFNKIAKDLNHNWLFKTPFDQSSFKVKFDKKNPGNSSILFTMPEKRVEMDKKRVQSRNNLFFQTGKLISVPENSMIYGTEPYYSWGEMGQLLEARNRNGVEMTVDQISELVKISNKKPYLDKDISGWAANRSPVYSLYNHKNQHSTIGATIPLVKYFPFSDMFSIELSVFETIEKDVIKFKELGFNFVAGLNSAFSSAKNTHFQGVLSTGSVGEIFKPEKYQNNSELSIPFNAFGAYKTRKLLNQLNIHHNINIYFDRETETVQFHFKVYNPLQNSDPLCVHKMDRAENSKSFSSIKIANHNDKSQSIHEKLDILKLMVFNNLSVTVLERCTNFAMVEKNYIFESLLEFVFSGFFRGDFEITAGLITLFELFGYQEEEINSFLKAGKLEKHWYQEFFSTKISNDQYKFYYKNTEILLGTDNYQIIQDTLGKLPLGA